MNEHSGHLLVVDDQREICDLLHGYLTGEGYRVSTAHDGAGMRHVMAQSSVDLVILNRGLPGDDGLTLARSLRQETSVGIIILSGRSEIADRILAYEAGADAFLPKPFHLRELRAVVQSALRRALDRLSRADRPSQEAWRQDHRDKIRNRPQVPGHRDARTEV